MLAQVTSFGYLGPEMRKEADRDSLHEQESPSFKVQFVVCSLQIEQDELDLKHPVLFGPSGINSTPRDAWDKR